MLEVLRGEVLERVGLVLYHNCCARGVLLELWSWALFWMYCLGVLAWRCWPGLAGCGLPPTSPGTLLAVLPGLRLSHRDSKNRRTPQPECKCCYKCSNFAMCVCVLLYELLQAVVDLSNRINKYSRSIGLIKYHVNKYPRLFGLIKYHVKQTVGTYP